jgi:hypothetical protein
MENSVKMYQEKFIMNSILNAMSANQIDSDDLRELSQGEKIEVNGGRACYRNSPPAPNPYRWVEVGGFSRLQRYAGRRYVNQGALQNRNGVDFVIWCRNGGYSVIR